MARKRSKILNAVVGGNPLTGSLAGRVAEHIPVVRTVKKATDRLLKEKIEDPVAHYAKRTVAPAVKKGYGKLERYAEGKPPVSVVKQDKVIGGRAKKKASGNRNLGETGELSELKQMGGIPAPVIKQNRGIGPIPAGMIAPPAPVTPPNMVAPTRKPIATMTNIVRGRDAETGELGTENYKVRARYQPKSLGEAQKEGYWETQPNGSQIFKPNVIMDKAEPFKFTRTDRYIKDPNTGKMVREAPYDPMAMTSDAAMNMRARMDVQGGGSNTSRDRQIRQSKINGRWEEAYRAAERGALPTKEAREAYDTKQIADQLAAPANQMRREEWDNQAKIAGAQTKKDQDALDLAEKRYQEGRSDKRDIETNKQIDKLNDEISTLTDENYEGANDGRIASKIKERDAKSATLGGGETEGQRFMTPQEALAKALELYPKDTPEDISARALFIKKNVKK